MHSIKVTLLTLALSLAAFGQLATQETTPLPIQSKSFAADTGAFPQNVKSGSELIVAYGCFSGGSCASGPGISDTLSTTWTSRVTQGSTTCGNLWVWTGQTTSAGADTVTISSGGSFRILMIHEFSNVSNTLDVASTATSWSGTSFTTPSITTTVNGDLLFAANNTCNSGYVDSVPPLLPLTNAFSADSSSSAWKLSGTNGSYNGSFVYPASSSGNSAIIAMKPAAALTVVTAQIPNASTSAAFSFDLHAEGGSGAYTWARTGGAALPAGLSLSSGGTISGTPTAGNGAASMTFQVTDGASSTATKSLAITVGTSVNTPTAVQTHQFSTCSSGVSLGTVTAGNLILILSSSPGTGIFGLTDSVGTVFSALPIGFELENNTTGNNITSTIYWGFAASTASDTLTCSGTQSNVIAAEYSGIQAVYDPSVLNITTATTGSPYTSGAVTAPVAELLFSWVVPFTSTTTITTQSPYTAGATSTANSIQLTTEYNLTASSGSNTASYVASGNTDTHWGIGLFGLRPTISGTAGSGVVRHRSRVF